MDIDHPILIKLNKSYNEAYDAYSECTRSFSNEQNRIGDPQQVLITLKNKIGIIKNSLKEISKLMNDVDTVEDFSPEEKKKYIAFIKVHLTNVTEWLEEIKRCVSSLKE